MTPFDGSDTGAVVSHSESWATRPICLVPQIVSDTPTVHSGSVLSCDSLCVDNDGDAVTTECGWTVAGASVSTGGLCSLSGSFAMGDEVTCSLRGSDGSDKGPWKESVEAVVGNSPPSVQNVALSPAQPTSSDPIDCAYAYVDPEGDPMSSCSVTIVADGAAFAAPLSPVSKGTEVSCEVVCTDDQGNTGNPASSATGVVLSSPPSVSNVEVLPEVFAPGDDLDCSYVFSDIDGDGDFSQVGWTVNGAAAGYVEVDVGYTFGCAKAIDDTYSCWGSDQSGGYTVPSGLGTWDIGTDFGCGVDAGNTVLLGADRWVESLPGLCARLYRGRCGDRNG